MDTDQTGTIDWWEFLNHEALKQITANRSKVSRCFINPFHPKGFSIDELNCLVFDRVTSISAI